MSLPLKQAYPRGPTAVVVTAAALCFCGPVSLLAAYGGGKFLLSTWPPLHSVALSSRSAGVRGLLHGVPTMIKGGCPAGLNFGL